jgi:hypothetical protein
MTQFLSAAALWPIAYAQPKLLFVLKNGNGAADVR